MIDLQAKIDALPEWPKPIARVGPYKIYGDHKYAVYDDGNSAETPYQTDLAQAALARLALAREWAAKAPHHVSCAAWCQSSKDCTCGRDALLKAMEVPR